MTGRCRDSVATRSKVSVPQTKEVNQVKPARAPRIKASCTWTLAATALALTLSLFSSAPALAGEPPEEPVTGVCNPLVVKAHEAFTVCGTLNPHSSAKLSSAYFAFNKGTACTGGGVAPAETEFTGELEGREIYVYGEMDDLRPGTQYTYCLVAKNPSGETFGKPATFTTTAEPKAEAAAEVTTASAILEGSLEPAGTKLEYEFRYSKGASCEGGAETPHAEGENKVYAKVEGLTPNTEYTFCLVAEKNLEFYDTDTAASKPLTFRTPESQIEKEAKEKFEQEAKAEAEAKSKAEAEAAAIKKEQQEAAAAKRRQEEEAAATKKRQEEAAAVEKKRVEEIVVTGSVSLDGSTIYIQSSDEAVVKLTCAGTGACRGKLTLTAKSTSKKNKKTKLIGTATFSISADNTATMRLTLNATGQALLSADHGRLA